MDDLDERYHAFLARHPRQNLDLRDVRWSYRPAGIGPEGLVLLPGAAGGGEAYFLLAEELLDRFRMVMIDYPPVSGLDEMLDGLAEILSREGIERTALLGGSFGGMLAQAFLLRSLAAFLIVIPIVISSRISSDWLIVTTPFNLGVPVD